MQGENATPNSGKFAWAPIKSPKQSESDDGVLKRTGSTLPSGAAKPDDSKRAKGT